MSKTILLIENDAPFAEEMSGALEAMGYQVRVTGDGKEGLDLARDLRPDAIVLCVELPRLSGYSICNKLKKDDALKAIPLVLTSSEATDEVFEDHRKLKVRAEEYLIKPYVSAALLEKVAGADRHARGRRRLPAFEAPRRRGADAVDEEVVSLEEELGLEAFAGDPGEELPALDLDSLPDEPCGRLARGAELDDDLKLLDDAFDGLSAPGGRRPRTPATAPDAAAEASEAARARGRGHREDALDVDRPVASDDLDAAAASLPDEDEAGGPRRARRRRRTRPTWRSGARRGRPRPRLRRARRPGCPRRGRPRRRRPSAAGPPGPAGRSVGGRRGGAGRAGRAGRIDPARAVRSHQRLADLAERSRPSWPSVARRSTPARPSPGPEDQARGGGPASRGAGLDAGRAGGRGRVAQGARRHAGGAGEEGGGRGQGGARRVAPGRRAGAGAELRAEGAEAQAAGAEAQVSAAEGRRRAAEQDAATQRRAAEQSAAALAARSAELAAAQAAVARLTELEREVDRLETELVVARGRAGGDALRGGEAGDRAEAAHLRARGGQRQERGAGRQGVLEDQG